MAHPRIWQTAALSQWTPTGTGPPPCPDPSKQGSYPSDRGEQGLRPASHTINYLGTLEPGSKPTPPAPPPPLDCTPLKNLGERTGETGERAGNGVGEEERFHKTGDGVRVPRGAGGRGDTEGCPTTRGRKGHPRLPPRHGGARGNRSIAAGQGGETLTASLSPHPHPAGEHRVPRNSPGNFPAGLRGGGKHRLGALPYPGDEG